MELQPVPIQSDLHRPIDGSATVTRAIADHAIAISAIAVSTTAANAIANHNQPDQGCPPRFENCRHLAGWMRNCAWRARAIALSMKSPAVNRIAQARPSQELARKMSKANITRHNATKALALQTRSRSGREQMQK
jgi:hypothetical protein